MKPTSPGRPRSNSGSPKKRDSPRTGKRKRSDSFPSPGVRPPKAINGIRPSQVNGVNATSETQELSSIQKQRQDLPIYAGRDAIIREIENNDTVVILGETGSGKTTQVPQYLHEAGLSKDGLIGITQTRRVAATSLAARISQEQGRELGDVVGYSVRFDEVSSNNTRIKFLTDGMLVRDLLSDPQLDAYSVIIVDEAHERTLRTDLLLSRLKDIQLQRNRPSEASLKDPKGKGRAPPSKPLKVIIMSATLDAEKFSRYFNQAKILYVRGRQHPVKIFYTSEAQNDFLDAALRTFYQIHNGQENGDVLIFLPGQEDIENLEKSIEEYAEHLPSNKQKVLICPLYSQLPPAMQSLVFSKPPKGTRKCILATNIAETAITIPGVKFVIDTGTYKEKNYSSKVRSGIDALITKPVSKASALQRAGRAGREGPGYCYRLYTEEAFRNLREMSQPEIQRSNLAQGTLQLKYMGQDPETIQWMDSPSPDAFSSALFLLYALEAVDSERRLTKLGREMAVLPVDPSYARAILASREEACVLDVIEIVSLLSASSNLFHDPADHREEASEARRKFRHPSGDHMMMLNVLRAYQELSQHESKRGCHDWCRIHFINERTLNEAIRIRNQLRDVCNRMKIDCDLTSGQNVDPILKCLAMGVPQNCAQIYPEGGYRQILGRGQVKLHPSSSLVDRKVPAIMYNELVFTTQVYARCVSSISKQCIAGLFLYSRK